MNTVTKHPRPLTRLGAAILSFMVLFTMLLSTMPVLAAEQGSGNAASDFKYTKSKDNIIITAYTGKDKVVVIPAEIEGLPVTAIADSPEFDAFNSLDITEVTIPASITQIGSNAFIYCYNLQKVTFEGKAPEIGFGAFDGAGQDVGGTIYRCHIDYKNNFKLALGDALESYNNGTLQTFGTATPAPTPEADPEVTPDTAFTFTSLGEAYGVSKYLGGYKTVAVPSTYNGKPVVSIEKEAFSGNRGLTSVVLPDSITSIGKEAFYDCQKMSVLTLGNNIESIGQMAFQRCNSLETINLPASVKNIDWNAFSYCKTLQNIKVDSENQNFKDIDGVLFSKDGKILLAYPVAARTAETYQVPAGTERIESDAFRTHYEDTAGSALKYILYPESLKEIGDRAFMQSNLKEVTIFSEITMGTGVYDLCKGLETVHVAEGVKVLPKNTLYALEGLKTLTLPSTLEEIGDNALERYPLTSITLPESLKVIGKDAFANTKLTSVTIPASVTTLDDRAFYINGDLKEVTISEGSQLNTINQYAFSGCKSLSKINLPDSIKTLGTGVFSSCTSLNGITLPKEITALGDSLFAYSGIQSLQLPETVTSIGNRTFRESALSEIVFPDSVTSIGQDAFYGCMNLTKISLPKNLTNLGTGAFQFCEKLAEVKFPDTIKISKLPALTFQDCLKLRSIHLPAVITETGDGAFLNCAALTVEYDTPILKRSPLDCHQFVLNDESVYELKEDGFYYTTKDLKFSDTYYVKAGFKIVPQENGVIFKYTGGEDKKIQPGVKSIKKINSEKASDTMIQLEVVAQGMKAGDKIELKAVHKKDNYIVTNSAIMALGKDDNKGFFTAIKTLMLKEGTKADDYNIFASLGGTTTWIACDSNTSGSDNNSSNNNNSGNSNNSNSSNSSHSSSGGSTKTPTTTTTTTSTETVSTATKSTGNLPTANVTATADTNGNAKAVITETQISSAMEQAKEAAKKKDGTSQIQIQVAAAADAKKVETEVPHKTISDMKNNGLDGLTISSPVAAITFDAKSLETIATSASGNITVTASKVESSSLSGEAKQTVGDRPVFNFHVTGGDKTISSFGGNVTLSVPYTPRAGEDTNSIVIYYINDATGKPEMIKNCKYNTGTGKVTFQTTHFSQYAVGYNKVSFQDVNDSAWYSKSIAFLAARDITSGTGNGNFNPNSKLTRADFVVMMMRAYGISPEENYGDNFSDAGNKYYTSYLAAAKKAGITNGIGDNKFAPEKDITRQEMFTLLYNSLNHINQLPKNTSASALNNYSDHGQIASWAKDPMESLVKSGIISGSNGNLSPTDTTTRAQMSQVLYNLISK